VDPRKTLCSTGEYPDAPSGSGNVIENRFQFGDRMKSLRLLAILENPGADAALRFVEKTLGPWQVGFGSPERHPGALPLPGPLRSFYDFAGNWPEVLCGQNQLLAPGDLISVDEKLVFFRDGHGQLEWATSQEGDDPPVWVRRVRPVPGRWLAERDPLGRFLLATRVFEASVGSSGTAHNPDLPPERARTAMESFTRLQLSEWTLASAMFASDDLVAIASPTGTGPFPGRWSITIGSPSGPEPIKHVALGQGWAISDWGA